MLETSGMLCVILSMRVIIKMKEYHPSVVTPPSLYSQPKNICHTQIFRHDARSLPQLFQSTMKLFLIPYDGFTPTVLTSNAK